MTDQGYRWVVLECVAGIHGQTRLGLLVHSATDRAWDAFGGDRKDQKVSQDC